MRHYSKTSSRWPGIEYYESSKRRHNGKSDRCYYIRYRNNNGKLLREKIGWASEGYTPQLASHLRAQRLQTLRHGDSLPKKKPDIPTLNDLAQRYFEDRGSTIKGLYTDKNRWKLHLQATLGKKSADSVHQLDIDRLIISLKKQDKATATIWNVMELLRRIINYAVERNLCPPLPFKMKLPMKNNEKTELLTPDQWSRLLKALDEYPDQADADMIRVALFGGLRKSEIFRLKWNDIDFRNRVLHIQDPKSGKDETVPINDPLLHILQNHPRSKSEYVFPGRHGEMRTYTRVAKTIRNRANLPPDFRPFHGMRHAFASRLAESGRVDMYHLQKLLRHRSPQMTQRYAHLRNEALLNASNVLGSVFDFHISHTDKKRK